MDDHSATEGEIDHDLTYNGLYKSTGVVQKLRALQLKTMAWWVSRETIELLKLAIPIVSLYSKTVNITLFINNYNYNII